MDGDARRGKQREHRVRAVVEERVGEQPTRRRDERRGVAAGRLGGDGPVRENAAERRRRVVGGRRVRMHVDVVPARGGA